MNNEIDKKEVSFNDMLDAIVGKYVICTKDDTVQLVDDIGLIKVIKYEYVTDMAAVLLTYKRIAGLCHMEKSSNLTFVTENGSNSIISFGYVDVLYKSLCSSRLTELNNND